MLRIDYLYQSNIVSALLISSEYQEMYTEKDYNHFPSISFPIKSCFRYKSGRFDQTIDTNDVLIEAGDIEFQVFKFPTLNHDVTLSFQLLRDHPILANGVLKRTQAIERLKRTPQIEFLLRTFLSAYSKTSQLFIDELLHEILFQIVPDLQSTTLKSYDSNPWQSAKIDAAKDYIYTYSSWDLRMEDLSAVANTSLFHFTRIFKQKTGFSPHEYLVAVRIEKAKRLLARGEKVTLTAFEVGFNSLENFSYAFKNKTGISPSQYKKSKISKIN